MTTLNHIPTIWQDTFNTNCFEVDIQHKKLFSLLANLKNAFDNNYEKEVITIILFELEDYTLSHFSDEEKILSKFGNGASNKHLEEHKDFKQILSNLKFDYVSEEKEISEELLNCLSEWLQNHILGTDKKEFAQLNNPSWK